MTDPFALSPFACRQRELNRADFDAVLATGELELAADWHAFQRQHAGENRFVQLRRYRQSRLAMLGALDILRGPNPPHNHRHTLAQVSRLADLLIESAWQESRHSMQRRFGTLLIADGQEARLKVFALGKLGGQELNFSSDVDLVFVHDAQAEQTSNGPRALDAHSYFERQARHLIQLLDSPTADGRVYRVDTRLRPFGAAGPLVSSHQAVLQYLESEGREWERFAWLRARLLTGGDDPAATDPTVQALQPFLYRRHLDFAVFDRLRDIKAQIIRQQRGDEANLKLGSGGIREIEFIVQALQLAFGGRDARLRGHGLWQALQQLGQLGHLHADEVQRLGNAWLFLRRLENLVQFIDDQQTHHLPDDPRQQQALAQAFQLPSALALHERLNAHRQAVHAVFSRLFQLPEKPARSPAAPMALPAKLDQRLQARRLPASHKERIAAILGQAATTPAPIAERLLDLCLAIGQRESYLIMLQRDPLLLDKLIDQLRHEKLAQMLQQQPFLLENLFQAEAPAPSLETLQQRWQHLLQRHHATDAADEESVLELARQFKLSQQFTILQHHLAQNLSVSETAHCLTQLAIFLTRLATAQAHAETARRYRHISVPPQALMLLAYGSLATGRMHSQSDLDLVMLVDEQLVDLDNAEQGRFLQRWVRRLVHWLTASTYHGDLYQLDTRLRPNGNAGLALVSLGAFAAYQRETAWTWEHLALVKSRLIHGSCAQQQAFERIRAEVLTQPRNPQQLHADIESLQKKMRAEGVNPHHATDFQWLACVLENAHQHPAIITPRSDEAIIEALRQEKLVDPATAAVWQQHSQRRLHEKLSASL